MRIKNAQVSSSLYAAFGIDFCQKFNLNDTKSQPVKNEPCVFFGCYRTEDIKNVIENTSSFKIVIWGGSDSMKPDTLHALKNQPNLYHIAISDYIAKDLCKLHIPFKFLPITPVEHSKFNLTPESLGDEVYVYGGTKDNKFYGSDIYKSIVNMIPDIKFNICFHKPRSYTRSELIDVYKKCFIGIRLTPHDGLPNTVIELGLLGRRCIHNGGLPSSIGYNHKDINSIVKTIKSEFMNRHMLDVRQIHKRTQQYIEISNDFLYSDFWS